MAEKMKIAAVTDDGKTISAHFGRATQYAVVTVEDGKVVEKELREKAGHHTFQAEGDEPHHQRGAHGFGQGAGRRHTRMMEAIRDCQVLLARGMGQGAHVGLREAGIRPILTEIHEIDEAVQAVIDGSIVDREERLH